MEAIANTAQANVDAGRPNTPMKVTITAYGTTIENGSKTITIDG